VYGTYAAAVTYVDKGRSDGDRMGRQPTPLTVRLAAGGLWIRAALRVPVLVFVGFYVSHGIAMQRSGDFPDGAFFMWLYYTVSEVENVLTVPLGWLTDAATGWPGMTSWLVAYSAGTAGYLAAGGLVWRGRRLHVAAYRTATSYLMLTTVVQILTLIIVVPGAVDAVRTGENAPVHPYTGMTVVHAYEWLLLPWSLALAAVSVATVALLRTRSVRAHLGIA
jgi:hypothetical protein